MILMLVVREINNVMPDTVWFMRLWPLQPEYTYQ